MARKKKSIRDEYIEGLKKLAFGDIKDSILLLFDDDNTILSKLDTLDLFNISEIKRQRNGGGMEIKFFDRLKALEKLYDATEKQSEEPLGFYKALEESAKNATDVFRDNDE